MLVLVITGYTSGAQHIQYRDKKKPVSKAVEVPENKNIPSSNLVI